jgi:ATP-dependent RNA helicase DDX31/DBP7
MGSKKTLMYVLPIVQCLASSTNNGWRPSPGGGVGVDGVEHKSGGRWCICLCPMREPANQMHSFANQLHQSLFPCIVSRCLLGGEKRKSEKARLRRGITLLVAMPGHLLDHLTKTESLPLLLWHNPGLKWLVLDKVDCLLDEDSPGGQVEQIIRQLCR